MKGAAGLRLLSFREIGALKGEGCMQFGFLGVNFKDAPLDIRDKVSFTDARKLEFYQKAAEAGIGQCMVLSTCNRSEVYYLYEEGEAGRGKAEEGEEKEEGKAGEGKKEKREEEWKAGEGKAAGRMRDIYKGMFPEVEVEGYLRELEGKEAMAYLFRIAAGLESLVLGEDQILGQVKEALEDSRMMGYSGKELNKIVRDAVTCAKRIKTEVKISEKPLSVSYIGIRRLEEAYGIQGKKILVIGSGKTAALALRYVFGYPGVQVAACSRNYSHAKRLREEFPKLEVIPYEGWRSKIGACDIVISATASPHLIVKREDFCPVHPMALLDLAAPRDIDTALAADPLVTLINLDTLQEIAEENQREREHLVRLGARMVERELGETTEWLRLSRMDDTIGPLQQRCSAIVADGCAYLERKLELGAREQKLVKKVLHASLQRLLREPIREMKRLDTEEEQEAYKKLVKQLFQI